MVSYGSDLMISKYLGADSYIGVCWYASVSWGGTVKKEEFVSGSAEGGLARLDSISSSKLRN